MDRVLTPYGGACPNDFSDPIDQDIRTQCALSCKIVVSEWRSVTHWTSAGRPPYQTGKIVHVHANTLQTRRRRTHGSGCARSWFCTAEPHGERRYENWITDKYTKTIANLKKLTRVSSEITLHPSVLPNDILVNGWGKLQWNCLCTPGKTILLMWVQ